MYVHTSSRSTAGIAPQTVYALRPVLSAQAASKQVRCPFEIDPADYFHSSSILVNGGHTAWWEMPYRNMFPTSCLVPNGKLYQNLEGIMQYHSQNPNKCCFCPARPQCPLGKPKKRENAREMWNVAQTIRVPHDIWVWFGPALHCNVWHRCSVHEVAVCRSTVKKMVVIWRECTARRLLIAAEWSCCEWYMMTISIILQNKTYNSKVKTHCR